MAIAEAASHIDICTDAGDMTVQEYREDVKERFALEHHPDVIERAKRLEAMREAATEARQKAETLLQAAEDAKAQAKAAALDGRDDEAEELYEKASDLQAKAERKEQIAEAKAEAVEELEEERTRFNSEKSQELRQAARKELAHALEDVEAAFSDFLDAFRKAEAVSSEAPHHEPLRVLSDVDVSVSAGARQGLKEKLEEVFAEHGRPAA
jgi:DNA repair exonuclease SbcCD ATPase subunit